MSARGNGDPLPILPVILGTLILGLWRLTEWARKTITAFAIVGALIFPIGIINPFLAMDLRDPPPVETLALAVYTPCLAALLYVYSLGRFQGEFRKGFW